MAITFLALSHPEVGKAFLEEINRRVGDSTPLLAFDWRASRVAKLDAVATEHGFGKFDEISNPTVKDKIDEVCYLRYGPSFWLNDTVDALNSAAKPYEEEGAVLVMGLNNHADFMWWLDNRRDLVLIAKGDADMQPEWGEINPDVAKAMSEDASMFAVWDDSDPTSMRAIVDRFLQQGEAWLNLRLL